MVTPVLKVPKAAKVTRVGDALKVSFKHPPSTALKNALTDNLNIRLGDMLVQPDSVQESHITFYTSGKKESVGFFIEATFYPLEEK